MCILSKRQIRNDMQDNQRAEAKQGGDRPQHGTSDSAGDLPAQRQPLRLGGYAHKAQRSDHFVIS
jgi:hypothetical protein